MVEDSKAAIVLRESAAIMDAETLLQTPMCDLDPETQLMALSVLDLIEKKLIGSRIAELKEALKQYAKDEGTKNANGSFKATLGEDGGWVEARARAGKVTVDEVKLAELLAEKGIPSEKVFKPTTTVVFDEKALEALITLGDISIEDVKAISDVGETTFVCYHGKPAAVKGLLTK